MPKQIVELRPAGRAPLALTTSPLELGLDTHWGDVFSEASLAEGPEIAGAVAGVRTRPPAERSLVVQIKAATAATYVAASEGLVAAVTALQEGGGTVSRQLDFGGDLSTELECEVLSAQISEAEDGWMEVHRTFATVVLTLTTQPQWLDEWETVGQTLDSIASVIEVPISAPRGNLSGPGRVTIADSRFYAEAILALDPSLYWPLNGTDGATDQSGNGRNGTGAGGITIGGYAGSPLSGETTATDFDGTDDYITSTYAPFVNGTVRTFCGWAYRDDNAAAHALISGDGAASAYPRLYVNTGVNDVRLDLSFAGGAGTDVWTNAWPGSAQWVHWACVIAEAADSATLYINGASVGAVSGLDPFDVPNNFKVGATGTGSTAGWNGKMAHVAVFERGLTAVEIADLYEPALGPTARRFVELGGTFRDYDPLAEVEHRAAAFSLTGTDGTLVADGDAIGPNVVEVSPVLPIWRTTAYLLDLSHRGSFAVRVRAEMDTDEVTCFTRVVWRSGQGAWKELGVAEVPSGGFYDLAVGPLHHYDAAEIVELRFDVRASAVESTTPFRLNLTTITPAEVYAVVRGLSVPVPSTGAAAFDSLGAAAFLDTRVSELGDIWDVVSGSPDFSTGGWGVLRSAADDADLESGLSVLLGTVTTHNSVVISGEVSHKGDPVTDVWLLAYIRYVDSDNWAGVGWRIRRRNDGDYEPYAALYMRHGGGAPVLLKQKSVSTGRGMRSLITGPVGITIADDGDYEVLTGRTGYGAVAPEVNEVLFTGNEAEFAVGGDLEAGMVGVLSSIQSDRQDAYTALFDIVAYSEVSASTQVDVVRSNGIGQLDNTQAVSAAGGMVNPQPVSRYDGRRIWLPPGRSGLVTAKVRSGDSEVDVDAGAGLGTDVLVEHRPAFASLSDALAPTSPGDDLVMI